MANKQLTAKVRIDTQQAHTSLDKLITKINNINGALNKNSNANGLEQKIGKQLLQQEKMKQAVAKTQLAEEKVTTQKNKTAQAAQRASQATVQTQIAEQRLALQTARTEAGVHRINSAKSQTVSKSTQIANKIREWAQNHGLVNSAAKSTNSIMTSIGSKLKSIAATYLGIMGAKAVIHTSDTITASENRINTLNNFDTKATQESMDKIYAASQRSRSSYTDMIGNVSKSMTLASGAFQDDIDNAIRFQEIMAEAYTLGGASAAEQSSSMYQMIQALGGNLLAGDELRSVREGAPLAYQAIEKFAQGVYNSKESLKDLASQGKITSDIVVAAIMGVGDEMDEKFKKTKITFAQAGEMIKNTAVKAFEPVLQNLNAFINSDGGQAMIKGLQIALVGLANAISWVITKFTQFFTWCSNNWHWLKYVVVGVVGMIVAYIIYWTAMTVANAVVQIAAWIAVHWQMLLIFVAIGVLIAGIVWLANTTKDGTEFICKALALIAIAVAAVGLVIFLVTGNVVALVIGLIIAAIALIIVAFAKFGEEIMGAIYAVGAFLYNLVVSVVNSIIQFMWTRFVEPFIGIIEWILNVCNGGFDSFGGAVANLIGQIISWFLSLGKVVTKIIDAIFGTDWTSGLSSLQDKVLSWGKSDNAITLSREAPTVQSIAGKLGVDMPDRIAYSDAYANGAEVGRDIENGLASLGNNIKDKLSGVTNIADMMVNGNTGGLDDFMANNTNLPNPNDPSLGVADAYNPLTNEELLAGVDETAKNTKKMADSMDLKDDELDYMRKLAEMEWRNEFTTAEIRVDMTNHNNINGERDWEDMLTFLSDRLREESANLAYGTHL